MKIVETGEDEKQVKQLEIVDGRIVDQFSFELRDAQAYGYEYVETAKLERALIALAAMLGAKEQLTAQSAFEFIAGTASQESEAISGLKGQIEDLTIKVRDRDASLEQAKAAKSDQEAMTQDVLIISDEQRDDVVEVLAASSEVLTRVPNQRTLAQQAIRATQVLSTIEPTSAFIVFERTADSRE